MKPLLAALGAAACLLSATSGAWAETVALTSRDGSVSFEGELVEFDGEFYRIDTIYGVLTVDSAGVTCSGPTCPDTSAFVAEFMISGAAESGALLLPALLEAFAEGEGYRLRREVEDDSHFTYVLREADAARPTARVRFRVSSSDEGFADLLAQQADIAVSFREITQRERELAGEAGLGDLSDPRRSRVVALDGLVPVVSDSNVLTAISVVDLVRLYSGEVTNWAEIGGPDAQVNLHLRSRNAGLSETFTRLILEPNSATIAASVNRHASPADLADAVAVDPFSIGITTFSERGNARALPIRGTCGYESRAVRHALMTEDYPLTAPHFIYTPARRLPRLAREFLTFTQSPQAQRVIRDVGFVDQALDSMPLSAQGDRLAKAILNTGAEIGARELRRVVEALQGGHRMTATFRFDGGAAELDAQSRANIPLVAEAIERGEFDGKTLLFAGFSDGRGDPSANRTLSLERAEAVLEAVVAQTEAASLATLTIEADGFGEAMPMACDEDLWGRKVNRRVEIWVR